MWIKCNYALFLKNKVDQQKRKKIYRSTEYFSRFSTSVFFNDFTTSRSTFILESHLCGIKRSTYLISVSLTNTERIPNKWQTGINASIKFWSDYLLPNFANHRGIKKNKLKIRMILIIFWWLKDIHFFLVSLK